MIENDDEVFVMGGAMLYQQLLPYANKLYVTWIHSSFDADVYFPNIDMALFRPIKHSEPVQDETSGLVYHYTDYERM